MAKTIKSVFKIVRGLEAELPILRIGELGYATDSNTLFVGDPDEGNVKINFNNEDRGMLNTVFKEMDKKIDAEPGKGLSTNDLTNELLEKILESASENFVINKIAEAQLDVDGSGVDLSGLASKDDLEGKVDKKIGYSLISDAELIRLASVSNYDDTDIKKDINKKADINHQHDQYLTSIPSQYVTNTQLTAKGYATTSSVNASLSIYAKSSAIPTKISQLTDDVGYLISIPEEYVTESELNIVLAPYALIADIPTKVGQLANDKGYLTSIPEEYVTETELNNKGYATTAEVDRKITDAVTNGTVDLSGYALKTEVPTKTSQLTNDSNYLTAIPYEYVTETELETELINKVDKVSGKGLSTNDLTNEMVAKINNAATQAYVTNAIAEARLDGSDVDLSGLATKDELNEKAPLTHSHNISDVSDLQTALNSKVNAVSGKSLVSDTEIARLANVDNYNDSEIRGLIPTKVSQLINDRNYLNSVPSEYVTETELNNKGYATTAEVDQKIAGAVTGGTVDLSGYALKTDIPTKVGQLTNDKGYLTSIPEEYITETELNNITGVLSTLETSNKSTIVAAINELVNIVSKLQNIQIFGEIVLSTTSLNLTEGNTGTINVKMDRFITHNQTVTISSNNSGVTVSPSTLTFTSDNYNSNQAVTVTAVQDDNTDDLTATLTFKSDKVSNKTATVKVTDDDVNVAPQVDYMYYGRLSAADLNVPPIIQYSDITEEHILKGVSDGVLTKIEASTLGKTSMGLETTTTEGDYVVVAVPKSKGYTVTKDNGIGGKMIFDEETAGTNGIDITINGIEYTLWGEILLTQGELFIYID